MIGRYAALVAVSCFALALGATPAAGRLPSPLFFAPLADAEYTAFGAGHRIVVRGAEGQVRLPGSGAPLSWTFEHANPGAVPRGSSPLAGVVNDFRGKDTRRWRTGILAFGAVRVESLYPGVDLLYYGRDNQIEYDLLVAAGADPSTIQMRIDGARDVSLDARGALVLCAPGGGCLRQLAPHAYQEERGSRRPVRAAFQVEGNHVRFRLGAYDPTRPLVIDPVIDFSTYLGGSGIDDATGIAVDGAGNMFVTGATRSSDFPLVNASDTTFSGLGEAFVVKLNAAGQLIYATYLGGSGEDSASDIAVDAAGNVYIAGHTTSADFPIAGGFDASLTSLYDAYVAVLSPTGTLLYSTYLGGSGDDMAQGIAVDGPGRVLVTGLTGSPDFPVTGAAVDATLNGPFDAFVTILNASVSTLIYATYLGGAGTDVAGGLAADPSGNIHVAGRTSSNDFPLANAIDTTLGGIQDVFVTKLTSAGSLVFSTYLGGAAVDEGAGVAVDPGGAVYVSGTTASADFPTTAGALDTSYDGNDDAFATKLSPAGTIVWSTFLGAQFVDRGHRIAVDEAGRAYVTGYTAAFPLVAPVDSSLIGSIDAFVAQLTAAGDALVFSTYLGGDFFDSGRDLAVLGDTIHVVGTTSSLNFPTTANAPDRTLGGVDDGFVTRILAAPAATTTVLGSTPNPSFLGQSVTLTAIVTGGNTTPTGTIRFESDGFFLASVPLINGTATFSETGLGVGVHNLVATYSGDATHAASTSNTVIQSVLPSPDQAPAVPTLGVLSSVLLAVGLAALAFRMTR